MARYEQLPIYNAPMDLTVALEHMVAFFPAPQVQPGHRAAGALCARRQAGQCRRSSDCKRQVTDVLRCGLHPDFDVVPELVQARHQLAL